MNIADHAALAGWLLRRGEKTLPRRAALGFRLGSVLPDCNPLTYLAGIPRHQGLHGHNAEVREEKIARYLRRAGGQGVRGFFAGLRLGIALHYLADTFTYPHHAYYPGTLKEHLAYEKKLHGEMAACLRQPSARPLCRSDAPERYAEDMQALYRRCLPGQETDSLFITTVCRVAFNSVAYPTGKEVAHREGTLDDGLVSAVR